MWVKALCDYYDCLVKDKKLPAGKRRGWKEELIKYCIYINSDGKIVGPPADLVIEDKNNEESRRRYPYIFCVNDGASKVKSYPFDHRSDYIFGKYADGTIEKFECFLNEQRQMIDSISKRETLSPALSAFDRFIYNLENYGWPDDVIEQLTDAENNGVRVLKHEYKGAYFVFGFNSACGEYIHDDSLFCKYWNNCMSTEYPEDELVRVSSAKINLAGSSAGGGTIISSNTKALNTYHFGNNGKNDSGFSGITNDEDAKCARVIDFLMHNNQKVDIGTSSGSMTSIMFWTTKSENLDVLAKCLSVKSAKRSAYAIDRSYDKKLESLLLNARNVIISDNDINRIEPNNNENLYMLFLYAYSGNIAIKHFSHNSIHDFIKNTASFQYKINVFGRYHKDFVCLDDIRDALFSDKFSANKNKNSDMSDDNKLSDKKDKKDHMAVLTSSIACVIYEGSHLPMEVMQIAMKAFVTMLRLSAKNTNKNAKHDEDNDNRRDDNICLNILAGLIKMYINDYVRKETIKMALDEKCQDQAYLCGRLFACLDNIERMAKMPEKTNDDEKKEPVTAKSKYFATAMFHPASVLPNMFSNMQYYRTKAHKAGYAGGVVNTEKTIDAIMSSMGTLFPLSLDVIEQGMFVLGYYQQKEALFVKKSKDNSDDSMAYDEEIVSEEMVEDREDD